YLKDKTPLIQDKATTVGVFFSKNIKKVRQDFLSEKLRYSQNKVIGREAKGGQGSKKLLVWFNPGYLKDKTLLIPDKATTVGVFFSKNIKKVRQDFLSEKLRFSQQKVKVKSKQSDRQGVLGSQKLLVWFSQGYLKDKTREIQDKTRTVGVFFSENIKILRQDFLSEKLRHGGYGSKMSLVWFISGYLKDKTRLIKDKSTKVGVFFSKNIKNLLQDFLSEKLRFSQGKVEVKSKQSERQGGQGSKKLLVYFSQG
ncbi:hypothetical protein M0802_016981, partial [Mischocyttarus mexicanus]